ncbi:MAG: 1-phosphofructokinase [Clostridia bacterium]|nr:1-phosphofructokinase [Clostridia bacterium]
MIYTLTLNPAIDYVVFLDKFNIGEINRSQTEKLFFAGKGINVSFVLNELGVKSVATGFIAGFTGEALEKAVENENIKSGFVRLKNGNTRINLKLRHGNETDINTNGPYVENSDIQRLYKKLDTLNSGDFLVLSGSVPKTLPNNIYEIIMERLEGRGVRFIVDAEKELLLNTLKYKPFLVKPNTYELGEMFGVKISVDEQVSEYAEKLKEMGAQNVLVSMGEKGALLFDEVGKQHFVAAHTGKAINTVGAGDSMLAGFLAGYILKNNFDYALKLGSASGSATAFSEGLANKEQIYKLM